uniref:AAA family ATPase n=1 Tax=Segatella hominis TaxID=2518605 RepID=UPI00402A5420
MDKLIGRKLEQAKLQACMESERSEFVVVYGRRRIGKTFLVRRFFRDNYAFSFVGKHEMGREQQLTEFAKELMRYSHSTFVPQLKNWTEAFDALQRLLETYGIPDKKVVFFDEMPWMDTPKSDFVSALENFWNGWANMRDDIVLVACGSATSWMVDKLLHNQGGLFNRITQKLYLRPFKLSEMEQYLDEKHFGWNRYQIAQCYMILGGIPFYLTLLNPKLSLLSNIDELFFADAHAMLRTEYNELYSTLFKRPDNYLAVIRMLTERKEGFTRKEISEKTKLGGAALSKILSDLEQCDFIFSYARYGNAKNNAIYRIKDFYTLFYYKYVNGIDTKDSLRWTHLSSTPQVSSWQGFSFELLCLLHLDEIKKALGIDRILNDASAWRSRQPEQNTQIDLVIERADHNINLCEMKFSSGMYAIDKGYEQKLRERMSIFLAETMTRCSTRITMITTYGVLQNKHSGIVNDEVLLDDLFE